LASNWTGVSARQSHTCAVKATGTLWCWGANGNGQLGMGNTTDQLTPTQESSLAINWTSASAGFSHTCALKTDGAIWCWGFNGLGQLGAGTISDSLTPVQEASLAANWAKVSVGFFHTCALKTTGTLWCWGDNGLAQLGVRASWRAQPEPVHSE
jgi:alpha-tubulin suppressor-like RCC1 family protein